jgi:hypothetical protein
MKYSWQVISSTISIFCAVLLFAGFNDLYKWLFLPNGGSGIILNGIQMLIWFLGLQILLAALSGAIDEWIPCLNKHALESVKFVRGDRVTFLGVGEADAKENLTLPGNRVVEIGHIGRVRGYDKKDVTKIIVDFPTFRAKIDIDDVHKEWELSLARRKMMACWATLLGHITGFSAINFFAAVQAEAPGYVSALAVALLAWFSVHTICKITSWFRLKISLADDGELDEAEELWSEETEETEGDIIALSVSFLIVQWARYVLTGKLPNIEGKDPEDFDPSITDIVLLFGFGIGVYFCESWFLTLKQVHYGKITGHARLIAGMVLAWSLFYGFTWLTEQVMFETKGMLRQIVIAGCTTMLSIIMIFALDTIADGIKERAANEEEAAEAKAKARAGDDSGDSAARRASKEAVEAMEASHAANIKQVEKVVRSVVSSLGILIGFAWEKAFDIAVEVTAESVEVVPDVVSKLLMSLVLAGIVIPNWTFHILPKIIEFKRLEEAEERGEEPPRSGGGSFAGWQSSSTMSFNGVLEEPLLPKPKRSARTEVADEANRELLEVYKRRNEELEANLVEVIKEIKSLQAIANEPVPANGQYR